MENKCYASVIGSIAGERENKRNLNQEMSIALDWILINAHKNGLLFDTNEEAVAFRDEVIAYAKRLYAEKQRERAEEERERSLELFETGRKGKVSR